jgi:hypothetical protein
MAGIAGTNLRDFTATDTEAGADAARLISEDGPEAEHVVDPWTSSFARALIDGLAAFLRNSPGVFTKMMRNAQHAAADLNVEPFQGLVEVIQNADDLRATKFALHCVSVTGCSSS